MTTSRADQFEFFYFIYFLNPTSTVSYTQHKLPCCITQQLHAVTY